MITVRPGVRDDLAAIVELVRAFIGSTDYASYLRFDKEKLEVLVPFLIEREPFFVAALGDGRLVGFVTGAAGEEPIGGTKMLDELAWWVEPSYRNGRTGPKLLRALEDWARGHGVEAMTMKEPEGSEIGRYYRKVGYVPVERVWFKRLG